MATTTIPWNDGSGDNIYVSAPSQTGSQTVTVTSDANTGAARSKVVTFASGVGNIVRQLTVSQEAGGPVEQTYSAFLSSYDQSNSVYDSLTYEERAYGEINTGNMYAGINLTKGANEETFFYFLFDLSSIPSNANILSVEVQVRATISTITASQVSTAQTAICRGTTIVGNTTSLNATATTYTMDVGSGWTGSNIQNLKVLLYAQRGTSRPNNAYQLRCYGAQITVKYTV